MFPNELFDLGEVHITDNVRENTNMTDVFVALSMHSRGNWGLVLPDVGEANDQRLVAGGHLFSIYFSGEVQFWIVTAANRRATLVFLRDEAPALCPDAFQYPLL